MSYDICGDNRFELIEKYKKKLIEATNIEDSPEEMKVLNDIFFRLWQMGWLDRLEKKSEEIDRLREMLDKKGEWIESCACEMDGALVRSWICSECGNRVYNPFKKYCDECGSKNKSGA